jgi:ABC-type Fe3+/spermidine/putrescine transport system ATPase subunit
MASLDLEGLVIGYGRETVVKDFTLAVADGEMVSLLGPSGAGKTTVLKAVAGLHAPAAGTIRIDGVPVDGLPPERRNAVMVFQKPLLFPFMNVEQNIGFGLRMRGAGAGEARDRIGEILEMTELAGFGRRKVHELSGGQQQRVALARALVLRPGVLLLDEPLSSLDATLRQQMRELILKLQAQTGITMVFVTHDQSEALMMSHRVSLLLGGRLRQVGTPRELFYAPSDPEVARFFGGDNFFEGRLRDGRLATPFGDFAVSGLEGNGHLRTATIRPEEIRLRPSASGDGEGLAGEVSRVSFEGIATRVWIRCRGRSLVALTPDAGYRPGQRVSVSLPAEKIRVFPEGGADGPKGGEPV